MMDTGFKNKNNFSHFDKHVNVIRQAFGILNRIILSKEMKYDGDTSVFGKKRYQIK